VRTLYDQVFEEAEALYQASVAASGDAEQDYSRLLVQKWPQFRELLHYSTPVRNADSFLGRLFVFRDVTHEREVDRMKTEFVSLASHELRTPLTAIKGFTEMVLDGDAGEINAEVAEYLGIVDSNAERLMALVNDLLDLSRIESGRIQLKSEPVDLSEVVKTVVVTMQPKVQEKGQSLAVSVDPAAVSVVGDKDKLIQVLTNYVSNAHKYTQEEGAIRLDVTQQDAFAHVAVADNGHGIAPEDQQRLFTRFYRVDNAMTKEVGGTGLGLSIVKQLIELQGGQVGVQSALGEGSTFWFTVPLQQRDKG
jgi:signal transduction histidine kinase